MIKVTNKIQYILLTIVAVALFCAVWGVQKAAALIKTSAERSESIRVFSSTSCQPSTNALEEPNFSGCNSLI